MGYTYLLKHSKMIGIFDSGAGGLTVASELMRALPGYKMVYFGDNARLPYGTKGAAFVRRYSDKITGWLIQKDAKIIVIACNTASAWAANSLKKKYKGVPIFEVIAPAVSSAVKASASGRIGVVGTPGTIKSGAYQKLLVKQGAEVFAAACPLLVPLAEEGLDRDLITDEIISGYLKPLKNRHIDTLILGCTHYPLLKKSFEKAAGEGIAIINPAEAAAVSIGSFLKDHLELDRQMAKGKSLFYFSDAPYNLEKIGQICFSQKLKIKVEDPFD